MHIDLTEFWSVFVTTLATGAVTVFFGAVTWLVKVAVDWLASQSAAAQRAGLNADLLKGIDYAVEMLKRTGEDLSDPATRDRAAAIAADYLKTKIPNKLRKLDLDDPQNLAELVTARFNNSNSSIPTLPGATP